MSSLFPSPDARGRFLQNCKESMARVGQTALDHLSRVSNGNAPRGGPFCALLAIAREDGTIEPIGLPCANEVIKSGVPSRHAEHEALSPVSYALLLDKLSKLKKAGEKACVVLFSSAQSCTTCHTKQEIAARDLLRRGLIAPGRFISLYGASYDETLKIAGFDDKIYAEALVARADDPVLPVLPFHEAPGAVQRLFSEAEKPLAVIAQDERLYATGTEARTDVDLFATAETVALRNACLKCRQEGAPESWKVSGTLYTTNREIGPLLFSEAGWTNVADIVRLEMPESLKNRQFETRETPGLSDGDFLRIVAGGYAHPDRAVRVFRDMSFENKAQDAWAVLVKDGRASLYNGAKPDPSDSRTRTLAEERFSAPDLSSFLSIRSCA